MGESLHHLLCPFLVSISGEILTSTEGVTFLPFHAKEGRGTFPEGKPRTLGTRKARHCPPKQIPSSQRTCFPEGNPRTLFTPPGANLPDCFQNPRPARSNVQGSGFEVWSGLRISCRQAFLCAQNSRSHGQARIAGRWTAPGRAVLPVPRAVGWHPSFWHAFPRNTNEKRKSKDRRKSPEISQNHSTHQETRTP